MSEFGRGVGGEDTDLLCVEVSALGAPPSLPWVACEVLQELPPGCTMGSANQPHEDFLKSLLLKTDAYRPLHAGLRFMEDPGEIGAARKRVQAVLAAENKRRLCVDC